MSLWIGALLLLAGLGGAWLLVRPRAGRPGAPGRADAGTVAGNDAAPTRPERGRGAMDDALDRLYPTGRDFRFGVGREPCTITVPRGEAAGLATTIEAAEPRAVITRPGGVRFRVAEEDPRPTTP